MTYTAIVFGIDFNNNMIQKIGIFELVDTSVIKDPEDTDALLDWFQTNEFDIKGYPYIQVHIQRWSGTTLAAQYQHFFRVKQVKIVVFPDQATFTCARFEDRLETEYFADTFWDVEFTHDNFGRVGMQVRPSTSVFELIKSGWMNTKSFKFETEMEYIPFDELPPI